MRQVTLQDVAKRVGVTKAAVSMVLNETETGKKFSKESQNRIREAARELGYTPNHIAQSLSRGKTFTLGFYLGGGYSILRHPFWGLVSEGIIQEAEKEGFATQFIQKDDNESVLRDCLKQLKEKRIDALVVPYYIAIFSDYLEGYERELEKVVSVLSTGKSRFPAVALDPVPGIQTAARTCISLGHTRFLWIGPESSDPETRLRSNALKQFVMEKGLDFDKLDSLFTSRSNSFEESWRETSRNTAEVFSEYYKKNRSVTVVFCFNESYANGVYEFVRREGLRIPDDISVVGFDDIQAPFTLPPMSAVSHKTIEIGKKAAELAIELVQGVRPEPGEDNTVYVASEYVERESTGPAKNARI